MPDPGVTMELLVQIGGVGSAVAAGAWAVRTALEALRKESAQGRKELYQHIDSRFDKVEQAFVRKDVYEADRKVIQAAVDETMTLINSTAGRICPYPADMPRSYGADQRRGAD